MSKTEFSHIAIGEEDDDVVIQAGAAEEPQLAAVEVPEAEAPEQETPASLGADEAQVPEQTQQPAASPQVKNADSYHETTLEDLESSSMGTTQKIVIALAIVLVIAIAVYCIALR